MNLIQPAETYRPIPERIGRLNELAYNLWWSWHPEAQRLFSDIDMGLWELVYHNPVKFLTEVRQTSMDAATQDHHYLARYDAVMASFDAYMSPAATWFTTQHPDQKDTVAYFSAEFGLHESLPIYSGGLGILARRWLWLGLGRGRRFSPLRRLCGSRAIGRTPPTLARRLRYLSGRRPRDEGWARLHPAHPTCAGAERKVRTR